MTEAEALLAEVEAPNARARSPLRKELWWARQFEEMLRRWIDRQGIMAQGTSAHVARTRGSI